MAAYPTAYTASCLWELTHALYYFFLMHTVTLSIPHNRNPSAGGRPNFRDVLLTLISDQETVLAIPQEDIDTHHLARVLGAPLEAGDRMYLDLKLKYQNKDSGAVRHAVFIKQS